MYHLTKKGTKGICRAYVRPCYLGGEAAFFKKMGIQGAPRPSVDEAKNAGKETYEKFYGKEKERQEKAKARKEAREAARAAEGTVSDNSPEYNKQLEETKNAIKAFNEKNSEFLSNSSGKYFIASQKLQADEQEYLNDLNTVGDSVSQLVNKKVKSNPEFKEQYNKKLSEVKQLKDEKSVIVKERNGKQDKLTADYRAGKMTYFLYKIEFDQANDDYRPSIIELNNKIEASEEDLKKQYRETYGEAYKQALSDVGVDFANGDEMFDKKVYNKDYVDEDFKNEMKAAISYYPVDWVDNVDSKVNVHKYHPKGSTLGYVHYSEGASYIKTDKNVDLYSGDYSTSIHEFGHVLEINNNEIGRAERLFLIQEKQKSSYSKVKKASSNQNCATDSMVREYSGVYYTGGSTRSDKYNGNTYELFTTGVEALFAGDKTAFIPDESGKAPQHRNFILGLFATTVRK